MEESPKRNENLGVREGIPVTFTRLASRDTKLWNQPPNDNVEAYTGKHAARRGDRTPQNLIQPRYGLGGSNASDADGDVVNETEAKTDGARGCRHP